MKLARFTEAGRTRLGIVATDTGEVIDVGTADSSLPTDVGSLLAGDGLAAAARSAATAPRIALTAVQLEAPIAQPPTFLAIGHLFGSSQAEHEEAVLFGLAASKGVYEGNARRVSGPSEFGRIVKGDILVTESTTEAFNILLPLLGGIVTDNGGLLSHAAIVSREYGIPGVVGTREATERITDGMRIRVDGDAGEVTLL